MLNSWPVLFSLCLLSSLGYTSEMLFEAHPVIRADRPVTEAKGAVGLSASGLATVSS